jgi:hypothetical protein
VLSVCGCYAVSAGVSLPTFLQRVVHSCSESSSTRLGLLDLDDGLSWKSPWACDDPTRPWWWSCLILKTKALTSFEMKLTISQATWHMMPEDLNFHQHCCENFESHATRNVLLSGSDKHKVNIVLSLNRGKGSVWGDSRLKAAPCGMGSNTTLGNSGSIYRGASRRLIPEMVIISIEHTFNNSVFAIHNVAHKILHKFPICCLFIYYELR